MWTDDNQELCLDLMLADSEADVISLLKAKGYWEKPELWRHYGDVENNWGQSGNQQSLAEAALAEKIVNSVDARLINECLMRGIDPVGTKAPGSIREAVARFFEDVTGDSIATGGLIEDWGDQKTREIAEGITFCATGVRPEQLNITVADTGEGQTPDRLPETILSLSKSNKMYVPFVQGQFNQGGTGALRFCGKQNLQLVVSKRNSKLLDENSTARDREWSFTVVRREHPSCGRRNSMYTYLAPIRADTDKNYRRGGVLSFAASKFPLFPNDSEPYAREAVHGTAVKMYEYQYLGEKSNILRGNSLLSRLDLLLPEIALPVRFYEYRRNKRGRLLDVGSRRTTVSGLRRRLRDSANVQSGFPIDVPLHPGGETLIARIFAFRSEGASRTQDEDSNQDPKPKGDKRKKLGGLRGYRKREGVVFVRNGQTQGSLSKDFFRREAVKMKPLADDLLVFVECDELDDIVREDLFMPSRDRLADNDFKRTLVDVLEKAIRDSQELRDLRNKRQQERMSERLRDEQPLTDMLQSLIKSSPNLTTLLDLGHRITSPFKTIPAGSDPVDDFRGEIYPTYFKTKGVEYGTTLERPCAINQRMRLTFETDARNDYFTRSADRGSFNMTWVSKDGNERSATTIGPRLKNGIAIVMLELPRDVEVGDEIEFIAEAKDVLRAYQNRGKITVLAEAEARPGGRGSRNPPNTESGPQRERPSEVAPPRIRRVYRGDWDAEGFDEFTAMKVQSIGYSSDESSELYEFKVNMDNTPLENEGKQKRLDDSQYKFLREQFLYANVLIGLSLLLDAKRDGARENRGDDSRHESVEERIDRTCCALAPFLPTLVSLGMVDFEANDYIEGMEDTG